MADVRYYKKFSPDTQIKLPDGRFLQKFGVPYPGCITGYFGTNSEWLQGIFADLMAKGQYALSEISWEEFKRDYVDPKANPAKPVWREEMGKTTGASTSEADPVVRLAAEGRQGVVAVKGCDQPGKPACGLTMAESPVVGIGRQAVANSTIAANLEPKRPTPAAGKRTRGTRTPANPQPPE